MCQAIFRSLFNPVPKRPPRRSAPLPILLLLIVVAWPAAFDVPLRAQELFIIHRTDKNIVVFDASRDAFLREDEGFLGVFGETAGNLGSPRDLIFQPATGHLFVVDGGVIKIFDGAGNFLGEFGDTRENLRFPSSLAFHPGTGHLLVSERNIFVTFEGAIKEFDGRTGAFVGSFGESEGNVNQPLVLAFQPSSRDLFVLDCPRPEGKFDCDVRRFGSGGEFLGVFGETEERLTNAVDMTFDSAGRLHVLHAADGDVKPSIFIFDGSSGELVETFLVSTALFAAGPVAFSVYDLPASSAAATTALSQGIVPASFADRAVGPLQGEEDERITEVTRADGVIELRDKSGNLKGTRNEAQGNALGRTTVSFRESFFRALLDCVEKLRNLIDTSQGIQPGEKEKLETLVNELSEIPDPIRDWRSARSQVAVIRQELWEIHRDLLSLPFPIPGNFLEILLKLGELDTLLIVSRPPDPPASAPPPDPSPLGCKVEIHERTPYSKSPIPIRGSLKFTQYGSGRLIEALARDDNGELLVGHFEWSVNPDQTGGSFGPPDLGLTKIGIAMIDLSRLIGTSEALRVFGGSRAFEATFRIAVKFTEPSPPNRSCESEMELQIRVPGRDFGEQAGGQQTSKTGALLPSGAGAALLVPPAAELKLRLEALRGVAAEAALTEPRRTLLLLLLDFVENRIDDGSSAPVTHSQLTVFRIALTDPGNDLSEVSFKEMLEKISQIQDLLMSEGFASGLGSAPPAPPPAGQCAVKIYEAESNHFVRAFSAIDTPFKGTVLLDNEVRRDLVAEARDEQGERLAGDYEWSIEPALSGVRLEQFSPSRPELVSTGLTFDREIEVRRTGEPLETNYRIRVRFSAAGGGPSCEDTVEVQARVFP